LLILRISIKQYSKYNNYYFRNYKEQNISLKPFFHTTIIVINKHFRKYKNKKIKIILRLPVLIALKHLENNDARTKHGYSIYRVASDSDNIIILCKDSADRYLVVNIYNVENLIIF